VCGMKRLMAIGLRKIGFSSPSWAPTWLRRFRVDSIAGRSATGSRYHAARGPSIRFALTMASRAERAGAETGEAMQQGHDVPDRSSALKLVFAVMGDRDDESWQNRALRTLCGHGRCLGRLCLVLKSAPRPMQFLADLADPASRDTGLFRGRRRGFAHTQEPCDLPQLAGQQNRNQVAKSIRVAAISAGPTWRSSMRISRHSPSSSSKRSSRSTTTFFFAWQ
jgi:hypothetical protein